MSKPDSPTVEEIFQQAIERPSPEERRAFLDSACAHDARLRDRIDALLRAHDAAAGFFDAARSADQTTLPPRPAEGPGTVIDKYKLLQPIGEGGFGAVYMAEQKEPVQRKVALKIIKLGMDTKQVIARFEAERQALAMMDHPNIARVLDAGATETGRPYFVMELVKGVPITDYCDTENLSTKERLDLFIKVCNAVQHAHQKGIIHRDLKPSNVMVTLHDGKPVPKVIDFGIAKAMNRSLTEKTLFTEYRQFIGTPEYMSPEQAEMSGLDIDTRSDIYSLGVLLYVLLTGVTPFDGARLRSAAINEIQRIIREEEPSRPSTRLSELSRDLPSPISGGGRGAGGEGDPKSTSERSSIHYIAKHRRTDPGSLARQLRGDLDWIVMKALEKDRARRYETANGFAMDIERYLSDEPVTATPPSATYRLKKLIRRNKGAFTAAAALFIVLTLGVIGTTWGLVAAAGANEDLIEVNANLDTALADATRESERAERELARANEVKHLIVDMFHGITPQEARGADITLLKGILDETSARLERGEITDELIAAELHALIGHVYEQLGLLSPSEHHTESAYEIYERTLGGDHRETLIAMNRLGLLRKEQGRYPEAEALFSETLKRMQRTLGEEHPDALRVMTNLALTYLDMRRLVEAERLFLTTLEAKRRVLGPEHPDTLRCMNNFGSLLVERGRPADAAELFEDVVELRERRLGDEDPETLTARINLALARSNLGQIDAAEQLLVPTLQKMRLVLSEKHPDTANCLNILGSLRVQQRRYEDAAPLFSESLEIRRLVLGDEHEDTLGTMTNLGNVYVWTGRYEEARELLEESVAAKRRTLTVRHPWTRYAIQGLARAYEGLDRRDNALPLRQDLLEYDIQRAEAPSAASSMLNNAAWDLMKHDYPELHDPARALPLVQRACALEEANGGGKLWMYLDTLALAQHMNDDTSAAIETQKRAISLMPPDTEETAREGLEARLREFETALAAAHPAQNEQQR